MVDSNNGNQRFSEINLGCVCPMASEEQTAVSFVDAVLAQFQSKDFKSVNLFVILDRACKDNTLELLKQHATGRPQLRVVWAPENRSVVDAYLRGYRKPWLQGVIGYWKSMRASAIDQRTCRNSSTR